MPGGFGTTGFSNTPGNLEASGRLRARGLAPHTRVRRTERFLLLSESWGEEQEQEEPRLRRMPRVPLRSAGRASGGLKPPTSSCSQSTHPGLLSRDAHSVGKERSLRTPHTVLGAPQTEGGRGDMDASVLGGTGTWDSIQFV